MDPKYTMQEILDALKKAEQYHYDKWGGKEHCPHYGLAYDLFASLRRRMARFLNPEDYGKPDG